MTRSDPALSRAVTYLATAFGEDSPTRCQAGRRWRCPPRRVRCELPANHGGEHMNGLDVWPTVEQLAERRDSR